VPLGRTDDSSASDETKVLLSAAQSRQAPGTLLRHEGMEAGVNQGGLTIDSAQQGSFGE